ncbi:hypothetical protein EYC84_010543 [Monilinia fructicola]|uniref:Uncharacterized protein n=1 Tax=Monilinia fructicola TaxID=38448 RepID=A0A5M9J6M6_MONFR|nr:hypothetical protein EYC84_010543 [Monilinia fructicola]
MASGPNATVNTLVYSTKDQQADAYLRSNPRPSGCSLWKCDENDVYQVPAGEIFCRAPWGPRNEICPKLIKYNATNNLRLHLKQKHSDLSFDKGKKGSTRMEDQAVAREAFAQCYRAHLEYEKSIGEVRQETDDRLISQNSHFSPSKKLRKRKRDERNHEQARVREEAEQIASAGPSRVVKDCPVRKYKGAMRHQYKQTNALLLHLRKVHKEEVHFHSVQGVPNTNSLHSKSSKRKPPTRRKLNKSRQQQRAESPILSSGDQTQESGPPEPEIPASPQDNIPIPSEIDSESTSKRSENVLTSQPTDPSTTTTSSTLTPHSTTQLPQSAPNPTSKTLEKRKNDSSEENKCPCPNWHAPYFVSDACDDIRMFKQPVDENGNMIRFHKTNNTDTDVDSDAGSGSGNVSVISISGSGSGSSSVNTTSSVGDSDN